MACTKDIATDMQPAEEIVDSLQPVTPDNLIPILQKIQSAYGYLPGEVLSEVSRLTGIPVSRMYGVATFYEQFHLEPRGRHTVKCCRGTACHVKGGRNIAGAVRSTLGIEEGETTQDMRFTFETVACLGTCFLAPAMMVDNNYYGHLNPGRVKAILGEYD